MKTPKPPSNYQCHRRWHRVEMSSAAPQANIRREEVPPHASVLVESMRDIGYTLQTAVADVIDNSITAGADSIEIFSETHTESPVIGILDNGMGMSKSELLEAMRPGTRNPLETRSEHDLGRFGLGLKTASFSQCRRLTVVTRNDGVESCATWDLDTVAKEDKWLVEFPDSAAEIPWADRLRHDGTLVVWQKLDRLVDTDNVASRESLIRLLDETASHLELVYHRYISGEPRLGRVSISLNGRELKPFDPFHLRHPATIAGPEDKFGLGSHEIVIQPVTLPHHQKVTPEEWDRYGGIEGYVRNQGFYLYREKRLIIHGTWFNLARQLELTKLARVRIDIPNGMDADWKIDVKKASAQPPSPVRERLRKIVETLGATSKRVYTARGKHLTSQDKMPVWTRSQNKNQISYGLNPGHPSFRHLLENLDDEQGREFLRLIDLVESSIPIDTLIADIGSDPKAVSAKSLEDEQFTELVKETWITLRQTDFSQEKSREMMASTEAFRSSWNLAEAIIRKLEGEYKL